MSSNTIRLNLAPTVDGEVKILRDAGHTGSLNDMMLSYLTGQGITSGGLTDRLKVFHSTPPGEEIPGGTITPTSIVVQTTVAFSETFVAAGGTGPYTYSVSVGTLPTGLSLASGGALTGTPTDPATTAYSFTVKAVDSLGDFTSQAISGTVQLSGITVIGTTTAQIPSENTTAGPTVVNLPTGLMEGDLVLIATCCDRTLQSVSSPTGWSTEWSNGSWTDPGARLYSKLMGASPDTTVSMNHEAAGEQAVVIQVVRGVDQVTPFDRSVVVDDSTGGSPRSPSTAPVTDEALFVSVGYLDDDLITSVTAPAGYTDLTWVHSGSAYGLGATSMMSSKLIPSAFTTETPGPYITNGSDDWWALSLILRAAVGGPPSGGTTFWRIYINSITSGNANMNDLQFRGTADGPDLTSPAETATRASASNTANLVSIFDDNTGTQGWVDGAAPQWIAWEFAAGTTINQVQWRNKSSGSGNAISSVTVESSSDGISWDFEWEVTSGLNTSAGGTNTITRP